MIYDITLLEAIEQLTKKGVTIAFYDCDAGHLMHKFPYDAKSLECVVIRVYSNSTREDIVKQINEARRNVIQLIKAFNEREHDDKTEYSDIHQYIYRYVSFGVDDIPKLSVVLA